MSVPDDSADETKDGDRGSSEIASGAKQSLADMLKLSFGLTRPVGPLAYAVTGFGLMAIKYAFEAYLIYFFTTRFFSPLDFLNPLLSLRQEFFRAPAPDWLGWALFVWSLPFLWIAVSMSVRRAANAGYSPWVGLLVLVPFVNCIFMLVMCFLREQPRSDWKPQSVTQTVSTERLQSALVGVAASLLISLGMVGIGIYLFAGYGLTLFIATPIVMGATSAFLYNRPQPRKLSESIWVAELSILIAGLAFLLFALEGFICLLMVLPLAPPLAAMGGAIGHMIAVQSNSSGTNVAAIVVMLPLLAGAESLHSPTPLFEIITTVEIDAPPERVWPLVIGFPELPNPKPWYFRAGIAYPVRATIEGHGVGAMRRCEFSTGAFIEPITAWEPHRRLAFDVTSQPPPMHELSIYRHVHPPHLDGYLRSKRGEFRLVPLAGGRTRLEGSTWYELEMYPVDYWTLWSDAIIHRIHERVLAHIKQLAEQN